MANALVAGDQDQLVKALSSILSTSARSGSALQTCAKTSGTVGCCGAEIKEA